MALSYRENRPISGTFVRSREAVGRAGKIRAAAKAAALGSQPCSGVGSGSGAGTWEARWRKVTTWAR